MYRERSTEYTFSTESALEVISHLPCGIYRTSPEGKFIAANEGMAQLFAYESVADLAQVPVQDFYEDPSVREKLMRDLEERGEVRARRLWLYRKDGSSICCECDIFAKKNEYGKILYIDGAMRDVSILVAAEETRNRLKDLLLTKNKELERMNRTDDLTGIANHRYGMEVLTKKIEAFNEGANPFAVIFFDLDHFKRLNDAYGHIAADDILKEFANLVAKNIRKEAREENKSPDLFVRWGGEEFILILSDVSLNLAKMVAERLLTTIQEKMVWEGEHVTASLGLSACTQGDTVDSLLERSDFAMYHSKIIGRNNLTVWEELSAEDIALTKTKRANGNGKNGSSHSKQPTTN